LLEPLEHELREWRFLVLAHGSGNSCGDRVRVQVVPASPAHGRRRSGSSGVFVTKSRQAPRLGFPSRKSALRFVAVPPMAPARLPKLDDRASGILLHPTSLPGPPGGEAGDLGPEARRFVDFLADAGQSWWQTLPVGPTGFGNSPYSAQSAFAGS